MSAFTGLRLTRGKFRACLKCCCTSDDWEGHHIMYGKKISKKTLCFDCHREITDMNTAAYQILKHKLSNGERFWLWQLFLRTPSKQFGKLQLERKMSWMGEMLQEMKNEFYALKIPASRAVNG